MPILQIYRLPGMVHGSCTALVSVSSLPLAELYCALADSFSSFISYVPIKVDYSDIYDAMAYFVGTPDGRGGHDSVGQRLGLNGQTWARTYWRQADMA